MSCHPEFRESNLNSRYVSNIPAVIRVDKTCPDSSLSLTFLHRYNVPRSVVNHDGVAVESTYGPARVPTIDGWYNSRQPFRPAYLSGCDVELGLDWFASVNAKFDGSRFQRPSEIDVARLPVGHSWFIQSGGYEKLRMPALNALAAAHGLATDESLSIEDLRESISRHVGTGLCGSHDSRTFEGCDSLRSVFDMHCGDEEVVLSARIAFLTAILARTKRRPLERLLKANEVVFEPGSKTGHLRRKLKKHIKSLQKAKNKSSQQTRVQSQLRDREDRCRQLCREWPRVPSSQLKLSVSNRRR
ncbi:hypothetical protein EDB19DRAFT_1831017 [Suillus lakei]|nr:hypothetical protein EDB19DRAFT_1831017 [Suillus lakei]